MLKFCKKCQQNLPLDQYTKDSSSKDGLNFYCKTCKSTATKKWKLENPDKAKKTYKEWAKANTKKRSASHKKWRESHLEQARSINAKYNRKRRAIKAGSNTAKYTSNDVLEAYGIACHLCGIDVDLSAPKSPLYEGWEYGLHVDHVVPLSKNGSDSLENVRPSHAICNLRKGAKEYTGNKNLGDNQ